MAEEREQEPTVADHRELPHLRPQITETPHVDVAQSDDPIQEQLERAGHVFHEGMPKGHQEQAE